MVRDQSPGVKRICLEITRIQSLCCVLVGSQKSLCFGSFVPLVRPAISTADVFLSFGRDHKGFFSHPLNSSGNALAVIGCVVCVCACVCI